MSYEYISWVMGLYQKHGEDIPGYIEACHHPDLQEFLAHQREQINNAAQANCLDYRWERLDGWVLAAEESLASGNTADIAIAFYNVGAACQALALPSGDEIQDMAEAKAEKLKSGLPLKKKQLGLELLREAIQYLARERWANDTNQELRIGDVAEELLPKTNELIEEIDKDIGISKVKLSAVKKWLREVAPDYARKSGAPRKGKK